MKFGAGRLPEQPAKSATGAGRMPEQPAKSATRAGARGRLFWPAFLALMLGVSGCTFGSDAKPHPTPKASPSPTGVTEPEALDAVARIGEKTITRAELVDRLMAGYGAEALRDLLVHEAVRLETGRLGITVNSGELERELRKMSEGYGSEQAFYEAMQEQLGMDREAVRDDAEYRLLLEKLATRDVEIPEADVRRYYEEHREEYGTRRQYRLAWIVTDTKETAEMVLGALEEGTDFASLASQYSTDGATSDHGGEIGWVDEEDPFQDPKLLSAAGQLKVGEVAGPLYIDSGYVVLELKGVQTVQGQAYEDVRDEILQQLKLEQAKPMHDLEQSLLSKYGAKVLDPRLKSADIR
ncbi:peptidyl-prolyl cis-trans isomerase [Cohnella caldifontis]|uniref:peptidyl-prolyl cis-trans isomerase n=1 Tax=Cohnella caldifontis TaxID=3027471 RepID=UPI0023EBDD50|nr:peptidyl-prolyl cis-trans isomerase [Cohnella sp. YIM B05605]